ncbi:MAG: hypothetical protein ABI969_13755, partial [bacterium]
MTVHVTSDAIELDTVRFECAAAAGLHLDAIADCPGDVLPGCEDVGSDDFRLWLEVDRERTVAAAKSRFVPVTGSSTLDAFSGWMTRKLSIADNGSTITLDSGDTFE